MLASPSFPVRLPAEMPGSQMNDNGSGLGRQKWTCLPVWPCAKHSALHIGKISQIHYKSKTDNLYFQIAMFDKTQIEDI